MKNFKMVVGVVLMILLYVFVSCVIIVIENDKNIDVFI